MPGEPGDATLKAATASGDAAGLATLHRMAGDRALARGEADAAAFFWTQAHVWALVAGDEPLAEVLARRLRKAGRLD
ncbi:MAG: hypothetical protein R3D25_02730 [Geminicoccaceae bacterium]